MKKQPVGLMSTKNQSPPATSATKTDYGYNFSTQSNYKKFSRFLEESNGSSRKQKNDKRIECNCWVCKILDSSSSSVVVTNERTTTKTAAGKYEAYNIVSETGDSIFYDPLFLNSNIIDQEIQNRGRMYIAEDNVLNFVQHELTKHFNGGNLQK